MNANRYRRLSVFLIAPLICFAVHGYAPAEQGSSNLQLAVNHARLPIFFQDQTLTDAEKKAILSDYQAIIAQLAPQGRRTFLHPKVIQHGERTIRATSALLYSAKYKKWPRGYKDEIGIIGVSSDEQECIVIQKKLSDGYRAAMVIKGAHQEACRSLPVFVELMNNLDGAELPAVGDFYYLHGAAKRHADEMAGKSKREIIDAFGQQRYAIGSMLELQVFDGRLMTSMHILDQDSGNRVGEMPVIYDEGRWKIFIALSGT